MLVVFGHDQNEMFDFNNHPSLAVYVGDSFEGKKPGTTAGFLGGAKPDAPPAMEKVLGHPELATHILTGLLARGFDPAFMIDNPKPERGMCHAVMNPLTSLTDFDIPTVPLLLNAYYAPQLTANRCYEVGRAVAAIVEEFPGVLLNLDIKQTAPVVDPYEERLAGLLAEFGRTDDVIVASFLDPATDAFRGFAPQVPTSAGTMATAASPPTKPRLPS